MSTADRNPSGDASISAFASFANKYEKSTGGVTREVARMLMTKSPPLTSTSRILDNATGTGIVIEEIQKYISATNPNSPITIPIIAADAAQPMIDNLNAKIKHMVATTGTSWPNLTPITTHTVPAEQLDENIVPTASITHAYMNFGLFFCSDPILAASHIYRSLAPGGTALITTWHDLGYLIPVRQTQKALYPDAAELKMPFSESWENPDYVKEVLSKAGFAPENVNVVREEALMRHPDLQEMAETKTDLFTALIRGPAGWKSEEARQEFVSVLGEKLKECDGFREEESGAVSLKMVANVAICRK